MEIVMLGGLNAPSPLQELIDCLYPPDGASDEVCAALERKALTIIQKNPALLAEHSKEDDNMTPLMAAIWDPTRCCSLETFKKLLQKPTDVNAAKDFNVRAIHYLARYNRHQHLHELLNSKLKADVNATTTAGDTAANLAALDGADQTLALLVTVGKADVHKPNAQGLTPLHVACFFGQPQGGKREVPITEALAWQYLRCIETLLLAGASVDARDQFGSTPAHILSATDIPQEIKLITLNSLIDHGADLAIKANNLNNAIAIAKGYEFNDFSKTLQKEIVPSLKTLAAKKVLESNKGIIPHLFEDLTRLMSKIKLGKGPKQ
jgi:ankyrin repeat protein